MTGNSQKVKQCQNDIQQKRAVVQNNVAGGVLLSH